MSLAYRPEREAGAERENYTHCVVESQPLDVISEPSMPSRPGSAGSGKQRQGSAVGSVPWEGSPCPTAPIHDLNCSEVATPDPVCSLLSPGFLHLRARYRHTQPSQGLTFFPQGHLVSELKAGDPCPTIPSP